MAAARKSVRYIFYPSDSEHAKRVARSSMSLALLEPVNKSVNESLLDEDIRNFSFANLETSALRDAATHFVSKETERDDGRRCTEINCLGKPTERMCSAAAAKGERMCSRHLKRKLVNEKTK